MSGGCYFLLWGNVAMSGGYDLYFAIRGDAVIGGCDIFAMMGDVVVSGGCDLYFAMRGNVTVSCGCDILL